MQQQVFDDLRKLFYEPKVLDITIAKGSVRPEVASRWAEHSLLWRMSLYIFDILHFSPNMFV